MAVRLLQILIGLWLIPVALFFYLWSLYDRMKERKDAAWKRAAGAWLDAKMLMDEAKANILTLAKEESCYGAGVKFLRNWKAGKLEYAKIPELDGVDISKFRTPGHFESRVSAI